MFRERRERSESIGFGKGDSMPDEKTLPHMKPVVLAKNNPAIIGVFPHLDVRLGWEGMDRILANCTLKL